MRKQNPIVSLAEQLTSDDARALVATACGEAGEPRRVCYPYHWFLATGSAPGLFGRRSIELDCLVDARNGDASTSDRFDTERREMSADDILPMVSGVAAAERAARRCLTHTLTRRLRTIADFRVRPHYQGLVYKTFWLIDCDGQEIIVDSANGAWHLLEAA